jgi:hypothetical protein
MGFYRLVGVDREMEARDAKELDEKITARIQELVDGGDLDGIADVNDNSSGGETNLIISFK